MLRVHVRASKVEPGAPELSVVTNVFSFAFCCRGGPVRRVVPQAMVEALEYLQVRVLRVQGWWVGGGDTGVPTGVCSMGVSWRR